MRSPFFFLLFSVWSFISFHSNSPSPSLPSLSSLPPSHRGRSRKRPNGWTCTNPPKRKSSRPSRRSSSPWSCPSSSPSPEVLVACPVGCPAACPIWAREARELARLRPRMRGLRLRRSIKELHFLGGGREGTHGMQGWHREEGECLSVLCVLDACFPFCSDMCV